jgi:hypothetical protein
LIDCAPLRGVVYKEKVIVAPHFVGLVKKVKVIVAPHFVGLVKKAKVRVPHCVGLAK